MEKTMKERYQKATEKMTRKERLFVKMMLFGTTLPTKEARRSFSALTAEYAALTEIDPNNWEKYSKAYDEIMEV